MKMGWKKRLLAGALAVLMMSGNTLEVLASNLTEPVVEVSTESEELSDAAEETEKDEVLVVVPETEETESIETEEAMPETETVETEMVTTEEIVDIESVENSERAENIAIYDIVENQSTDVNVQSTGGAISNLSYTFTDKNGQPVSTENTVSNTIKLVIFDVNQTSSLSPVMALKEHIWSSALASEKVQFVWLCYNGTTAENFASNCPNHNEVFNNMKSSSSTKAQEMVNRFSVCLNGENLTEASESKIAEAFEAYWSVVNFSTHPSNEKEDVLTDDVSDNFPIVYMVNSTNQIVGVYQYNDEKEYNFYDAIISDMTQYIGCDLAPVQNLSVIEEDFEEILIEWDYVSMDGVDGFRIYRSEDGGKTYSSEYEDNWQEERDDNGNILGYFMNVDAPLDAETGNNGIYTYKVVPVDDTGLEGETATITNKGGSVGSDMPDTEFTGISFVDEAGNSIDTLELHVGEAKKIGLAFTKADGSLVNMLTDEKLKDYHTYIDQLEAGYQYDINWKIKSTTSDVTNWDLNIVDYETSDLDWLLTEEVIESKEAYFKANSIPAEGTKYFIEVRVTGPLNYAEIFWLRLPIKVMAAEEGKTYEQPTEFTIITSQEEAEQEMRELMADRDYDSFVVTSGVPEFDHEEVLDIYAEREGMKPNEGDYFFYTMGDRNSISTFISYFNRGYITYKNKSYDVNSITMPFITTAAEEAEVDAKIEALVHTPGGALYEYAHGEDVTDEEKVKAIFNWIRENVSGTVPGDRRTPIYHTAYHTLIKGSGTCGAFAVLFTRLTREMGIASKVIMGTDSAAHAYNIVQLGHKWYFIDTNTNRYLSDATEFTRAQEQEHYLDDRFIKNYLSKIPGNTYVVPSEGIAVVTDSIGTEATEYENLEDAVTYVMSQASAEGNEAVEYTITIEEGNMAFPDGGMLFEDSNRNGYGNRVTIDLGGYTLIVADGKNPAVIGAKYVHNGVISVGDDACLRMYAGVETRECLYENIDVIYKSTTSGADNTPMLSILVNSGSKLVLADTVTVEKFSDIFVSGDVEVNCDLAAAWVELGDQVNTNATTVIHGSVSADDMLIMWGGNIDVDKLTSKTETQIHNGDKATLTIGEELKLSGLTALAYDEDAPKTLKVVLERHFNSAEDKSPCKAAVINWSGNIYNYGVDDVSVPMFRIVAKDYVGEELQANTAFSSGSTIGTVTAKGLECSTGKYTVAIAPTNYEDYLTVDVANAEKNFVDIENNVLSVVSKSVVVTYGEKKAEFSSLKKAIDGLATVANKAAGEYIFTFSENTALSANVTLPDYVKSAIFKSADGAVEIDFKGYSLTTKGDVSISEDVYLVNSASTNGKLISTKSCDITDYAIGLWEEIEGVNLSATSGTLMLVGVENTTKTINADITAKNIIVRDIWEVNGTITNSGIHNIGTLICNTLTQTTANQTNLEANSVLVVKKQADLYNVTCVESEVEGQPSIYKMKDAAVSMSGTFKSESRNLIFSVLAENDADDGELYDTFVDFTARQPLFTSAIKNFPVEKVELLQNSALPKYTTLLQVDGKVVVVGEWIILKTQGVDGKETVIKKFTNWKEASNYINNLSNTAMTYVVEVTDDLRLEEALTMPTKVAGIIFRGAKSDGNNTEFIYVGDLKLATNTTFENMNLSAEKYDSKTKSYVEYKSAVNLSGKNFILRDTNAEFASVTGAKTSQFVVEGNGTTVDIDGAIKTLDVLEVSNAILNVGASLKSTAPAISAVKDATCKNAQILVENGSVAMTGTLFMENAVLDANTKINLVHVISNSETNQILYGGNGTTDILTITGSVTAGEGMVEDNSYSFRRAAIDITVKSLEGNYEANTLLLNAAKASGVWFVVGSTYTGDTRTGYDEVTHKEGTVIKYGEVQNAAASVLIYDNVAGDYIISDSFATLQEAFDEIGRMADPEATYRIVLHANAGDEKKPITTPAKIKHLTIASEEGEKQLTYSNGITLKSDVTLENISLAPSVASSSLTLGDYVLELKDCSVAAEKKLGTVSGSSTKKTSELILDNTDLYVYGTVKGIGSLTLADATLTAESDITVGNIVNPEGTSGKIIGTAAITRSKEVITKVAPKITIEGTAQIVGNGVEVTLREKLKTGFETIDFSATEANTIRETGIAFVKAANLSTDTLTLSQDNFSTNVTMIVTKAAGYLQCTVDVDYGATVSYEDINGNVITTQFIQFADAVTEINNLKTKRDYTITLYDAVTATSSDVKKTLTMPNKTYVETLTIAGAGAGDYVELHHTGNLTFTSPTILKDVYFKKIGAEEYAAAITVSTSGNPLTIAGNVYFNTPVTLNGGNKGILDITNEGQLCTLTNGVVASVQKTEQYLCGSVTGFAEVNIDATQKLTVSEFGTVSGKNIKFTSGSFNATTLNCEGEVTVVGDNTAGAIKLTTANLKNGHLYSNGSINIKDISLEGEVVVRAEKDFNITGNVVSATSQAAFYSRQKTEKNPVPYLNISGSVTLTEEENKIKVGVYPYAGAENDDQKIRLCDAPKATAQLLTAKAADVEKFVADADNVGNVGAYSSDNTAGYFLMKNGTAIYVYYGADVAVALCEGNADTGNLADANVIAYYPSFKDAVAAIDAKKDKTAEYTLVLLQDVNSATKPAAITMPKTAGNVIVTSAENKIYGIYYTGNITIGTATEFVKVCFNPINAKQQGQTTSFSAGNFDLTLRDVELGDVEGMIIKDVTGSAKQTTTLATEGLQITGNVMNSNTLVIEKTANIAGNVKATTISVGNGMAGKENCLNVTGTLTTDKLVMNGYTAVNAGNTITIKDIINEKTEGLEGAQTNTIYYGKNKNGAPNLTFKGNVSGSNETKVILNLLSTDKDRNGYMLKLDDKGVKYTPNDAQKLLTMEKAFTTDVTLQLNGAEIAVWETVKANKGVYVIEVVDGNGVKTLAGKNEVVLIRSKNGAEDGRDYCLDFTQAINIINNLADKEAEYSILVGLMGEDVKDVNLTDANATSAITVPKKNVAVSVTVLGDSKVSVLCTGNIAYAGNFGLENCKLTVANLSNIETLTLDNADLFTTGTVTVKDVVLKGESHWDTYNKTTITNLDVEQATGDSYLSSKQTAKTLIPMFEVKETVNGVSVWKVIAADAKNNVISYVPNYAGVSLAVASKESADRFVAYDYKDNGDVVSYKVAKGEIRNDLVSEMAVRIVQSHEGEVGQEETYAKTFAEAVTIINDLADVKADYRMELLEKGTPGNPIGTGKNGVYGTLTLPTKAKSVTITGGAELAIIGYTGTMKINCNTIFDNVALSEGTVDKEGKFAPSYKITPSGSGAHELVFRNNAQTLTTQSLLHVADVNMASVNLSKGTLILDETSLNVETTMTVKALELKAGSTATIVGKATITDLIIPKVESLDGTVAILRTQNAATITNIISTGTENYLGTVRLENYFTAVKSATQESLSQLTINGNIEGVNVQIAPWLYDLNDTQNPYEVMTGAEVESFYATSDKPGKAQKLATTPKASTENVSICYYEDSAWQNVTANLYKQDGALYLTERPMLVKVVAEDEQSNVVYEAEYMTWEQAVKEIDKKADNTLSYEMILLDVIGVKDDVTAPIASVTFPAKAKEVKITSEAGEENYIVTTGAKLSLKCDTELENAGIFAVKKVTKNGQTDYIPAECSITAGNYELSISDMIYQTEDYYNWLGTVSGSTKGSLTVELGSEESNNQFAAGTISGFGTVEFYNEVRDEVAVENQVLSVAVLNKGMTGVGTLQLHPGTVVASENGSVSVKNADIYGGTVLAKDITVSQTSTLESAILSAGSKASNDGKLKLKDIVLGDADNYLSAEQDKSGKTQVDISGTITVLEELGDTDLTGAITVGLYYNNYSSYAQLSEDMVLLNAQNAEVFWFRPYYTTYDSVEDAVNEGMGYETEEYGLYRDGKEIKYGAL